MLLKKKKLGETDIEATMDGPTLTSYLIPSQMG